MNIKVRREVVRCASCKKENEFFYLSDYAYGERLVLLDNGIKYAYINLLENEIYDDFINKIKIVLKLHQKEVIDKELNKIIDKIFGMACDEVQGCNIDFGNVHKKCIYCAKEEFEELLIEPEKIVYIDIPSVTHKKWENMDEETKIQLIEKRLKDECII